LIARSIAFCAVAASVIQAQAAPARWTGTVELSIGSATESRDAYMFGEIGGLASDAAGRIVVADPHTSSIRVFSAAGKHLYTFGRPGSGPGDLAYPCCIAFDQTGRLWVRERENQRHSLFALDEDRAKFIKSLPVGAGFGEIDRLNWDGRGGLMYVFRVARGGPMRTVRFHMDTLGKEYRRDTLREPLLDPSSRITVRQSAGVFSIAVPYAPRLLRAEGPGGQIAEANSRRYEVTWLDGDLKVARTLRVNFEPPLLSARERAASRDSVARFNEVLKANVDLRSINFPTRKPAIASLTFDLAGRLWVERSVADGQPREADVYDSRGMLIARASWPTDVSLRFGTIRGPLAIGIRTDESDVPSVVRLRFSTAK
jgi:hypothetical protein